MAVQVATLKREEIASQSRFTATVREQQRIELSFKVPGTVASFLQVPGLEGKLRDVHEGDEVRRRLAHPLASLDDSDYQATPGNGPRSPGPSRGEEARDRGDGHRGAGEFRSHARPCGNAGRWPSRRSKTCRPAAMRRLPSWMASRREVSAATTALQQAEDDRKHCSLRLPIAKATVSRKYVESGERVQAGQPVFQVMDLATMRAAFGVPDTKVDQFSSGQTHDRHGRCLPGEQFVGRVSKILACGRPANAELRGGSDDRPSPRPAARHGRDADHGPAGKPDPVADDGHRAGQTPEETTVFTIVEEGGRKVARRRRVELDGVYDNRIRLVEGGRQQGRRGADDRRHGGVPPDRRAGGSLPGVSGTGIADRDVKRP